MNIHVLKTKLMGQCVSLTSRAWPQAAFYWRNRSLFRLLRARVARAIVVGGVSVAGVLGAWHFLVVSAWIQSHHFQWQRKLKALQTQQQEFALQEAKFQAQAVSHARRNSELLEYHAQVDELILAWPNSALRMQLISHLQKLAHMHKLHIAQLKLTPLPSEQGFEVAVLDFRLKGPQWATFVYWQSMTQLFQNGIWPALSWRLLPDGEYALEGQVHLLWDAEDAFTDTGVELQERSRVQVTQRDRSLDVHVLPDHPVGQMRLVGTVQPLAASNGELFWTLLQSGRQIMAVRKGHYLGVENRRVLSLDAQGLWLEGDNGQPPSLMAWDKGSP